MIFVQVVLFSHWIDYHVNFSLKEDTENNFLWFKGLYKTTKEQPLFFIIALIFVKKDDWKTCDRINFLSMELVFHFALYTSLVQN